MVSAPKKARPAAHSAAFHKVAECLYRHQSSGVYYGLVKRSGKQYRRSLKTKDRKLAERFLSDFRQKIGHLDHTKAPGNLTFDGLAKTWLASVTPHMKASSAGRRETSAIKLSQFFGAVPIRNITSALCERWAQERGAGIAASTYNNERDTIIAILRYAKREGLLLDNPAEVLPRRKQGKAKIQIPTKEEFQALVAKLREFDVRAVEAANLVEVLGYSGMRLREATSFCWGHVDFARERFVVTGGDLGTKNHEARVVPLFPAFRQLLERIKGKAIPDASDSVINIASAKTAIAHACKALSLPRLTHHCMRHYFVSNAIEAGVDFKTIAAWVGHKDGGLLVAKTYGHLRDTHSFEMAKRMTFSAA